MFIKLAIMSSINTKDIQAGGKELKTNKKSKKHYKHILLPGSIKDVDPLCVKRRHFWRNKKGYFGLME
jgi:hypothetical protein